ncbi:hypothetical protein HWN40_07910 [Methanolobus zinderi]|jgi:hypothetical protein|uniref:Uncharacterized protein n=1 Tax=Methanolobus zinderi TaxID=536044 RepID=A0A7D5J959_9EURY|nr:hypothetical protein [Methanolobus zinderi]KXS40625.1 MAG: hypothetical protein AWU59_2455 [Methanolobus sp. T82-4]QLC50170.1 hypothetical protein HWN40_07910 [Methanolobus zinderi]
MKVAQYTFKESESAVSSVVAAVLLLGIIVSVITVVNVSYIPEWKTGAEQAHMDEVLFDMSNLKSHIDILSATADDQSSSPVAINVPIRAGGGSIPVVSPDKSGGVLGVGINDISMRTSASDSTLNYSSGDFLENLGSVSYRSDNSYFVDQEYEYENGALILAQGEYSLMKQSPSFDIRRADNNSNISLNINAVQIRGPVRSISSNSMEELHIRYNSSSTLYSGEQLFTEMILTIDTDYPVSWERFLEKLISDAGLKTSEYSLNSNSTAVVLTLSGSPGEDIKANIRKDVFDVRLNVYGS